LQIELGVQSDPQLEGEVDRDHLRELVMSIAREQRLDEPATIGLLITNDDTIRELNLRYRGLDSFTDVLAFPHGQGSDGFVSPPSEPPHLGDVVVSFPRAVAQAAEHGHSAEEELDRLVVHGVLHLLGYDDQSEEEREAMWRRQEAIVRSFRDRGE
jgi:probable rRNA maturation factor